MDEKERKKFKSFKRTIAVIFIIFYLVLLYADFKYDVAVYLPVRMVSIASLGSALLILMDGVHEHVMKNATKWDDDHKE